MKETQSQTETQMTYQSEMTQRTDLVRTRHKYLKFYDLKHNLIINMKIYTKLYLTRNKKINDSKPTRID
jgi:hypothetical protein